MDESHTSIILFAHGSVVREANRQVCYLAEEVSRLAHCPVDCAFLEQAPPDLPAAVAQAVERGARRIVVIPYFLTMGVHVRNDLPRLIDRQRSQFPGVEILVGQPLGDYPGMPQLILDRVRELLPSGALA